MKFEDAYHKMSGAVYTALEIKRVKVAGLNHTIKSAMKSIVLPAKKLI